jgi:phage terminase small subunit
VSEHDAPSLTRKQRAFVEAYLRCWNGTEAALEAGYSEKSARAIASENLTKPDILSVIEARLTEFHMSADEVLMRLTSIARGNLGDFLTIESYGAKVDLTKAQEAAKLNLIKKLKVTKQGVEIELHDPLRALELLGKHYQLFADRLEINWRTEVAQVGMDPDTLADELFRKAVELFAMTEDSHSTP